MKSIRTAGVPPALTTANAGKDRNRRRTEMNANGNPLEFFGPRVRAAYGGIEVVRAGETPAVRSFAALGLRWIVGRKMRR
jgi:hypothetical protein